MQAAFACRQHFWVGAYLDMTFKVTTSSSINGTKSSTMDKSTIKLGFKHLVPAVKIAVGKKTLKNVLSHFSMTSCW